jgi:hypothetical protein
MENLSILSLRQLRLKIRSEEYNIQISDLSKIYTHKNLKYVINF